jgi:hypothetical protein
MYVGEEKGMQDFGEETWGKETIRKARRRWEDKNKMDLMEVQSVHGLDRSGSRHGQVTGFFECGNEPSGSIKCGEFPDDILHLRKASAPYNELVY